MNLPTRLENRVQSLGWEDPLEEGIATHSSILAWEIPRTEEPGGLQSKGLQRVQHDLVTNTSLHFRSAQPRADERIREVSRGGCFGQAHEVCA